MSKRPRPAPPAPVTATDATGTAASIDTAAGEAPPSVAATNAAGVVPAAVPLPDGGVTLVAVSQAAPINTEAQPPVSDKEIGETSDEPAVTEPGLASGDGGQASPDADQDGASASNEDEAKRRERARIVLDQAIAEIAFGRGSDEAAMSAYVRAGVAELAGLDEREVLAFRIGHDEVVLVTIEGKKIRVAR